MEPNHLLTPYTKINSKWIEESNVKPETIKLLGGHTVSKLFDISLSHIFLDVSPQARATRTKIIKWEDTK